MKKVVYKYPLPMEGGFSIEIPVGAEYLTTGFQPANDEASLWALVDPEADTVSRQFKMVSTGYKFDTQGMHYIGTFFVYQNQLVFHLFEEIQL